MFATTDKSQVGFFAQTVRIKVVSPQAAHPSMCIFTGKSVVLHLHEGPD